LGWRAVVHLDAMIYRVVTLLNPAGVELLKGGRLNIPLGVQRQIADGLRALCRAAADPLLLDFARHGSVVRETARAGQEKALGDGGGPLLAPTYGGEGGLPGSGYAGAGKHGGNQGVLV